MDNNDQYKADDKNSYRLPKAVALRYRHGLDRSPVVTAGGQGWLAERIISLAREHGVPVYEDKSLVEILRTLRPGQEIPSELFETVAAILAFVMTVDRRLAGQRTLPARPKRKQTKE